MPPHCDSLDGPVVQAARNAIESKNVDFALPFVPASAEGEIRTAFDMVMAVRGSGSEARAIAERWFFETIVRLHLAGEGKHFGGLRAAGGHPPIIPLADNAIQTGDVRPVARTLVEALEATLEERFTRAMRLKHYDPQDIAAARSYTSAMLSFIVWTHHTFEALTKDEQAGHAAAGTHHGISHVVEGA